MESQRPYFPDSSSYRNPYAWGKLIDPYSASSSLIAELMKPCNAYLDDDIPL